jgi:hypothetical protein
MGEKHHDVESDDVNVVTQQQMRDEIRKQKGNGADSEAKKVVLEQNEFLRYRLHCEKASRLSTAIEFCQSELSHLRDKAEAHKKDTQKFLTELSEKYGQDFNKMAVNDEGEVVPRRPVPPTFR